MNQDELFQQLEQQSAQLQAANRALHEANEQLRAVFESIKDYAVFTVDLDNRITRWNAGAERLFGWTEPEALGQSGALIFVPEDRAHGEVEKELLDALERGYAEDKRWHLRADGTRFFANGFMRQLRDREGVLRGFIKVAQDATSQLERERAEERLRESEYRLKDTVRYMEFVLEVARAADYEIDVHADTLRHSPRLNTLFGFPPDASPSLDDFRSRYHPEDREIVMSIVPDASLGANVFERDYRIILPDNSVRWLHSRGEVFFDANGRPIRVLGAAMDITERKQAEAAEREQRILAETLRNLTLELTDTLKLETVLERATAAIQRLVPCDAAYIVLVENGELIHTASWGLAVADRTAVERWHRRLKRLDQHPLYRGVAALKQPAVFANSSASRRTRLPLAWADSLLVAPVRTENTVIGYFVILNKSANAYEDAHCAKLQAFAYQVAAAIGNARYFLQAQELAALHERQNFARELHDAVSQTLFAASVIVDGLSWHQVNRPNEVPEMIAELNRLVKGALAELRTLLLQLRPANLQSTPFTKLIAQLLMALQARKRVSVSLEFEGEPVLLPEVQLVAFRIVQEALNNITKHAQATQVEVTGTGGQGYVELHIRDNGRGFAPNDAPPGMGLQMMRERADEIGAALKIRSAVGSGTEVHLVYPQRDSRKLKKG